MSEQTFTVPDFETKAVEFAENMLPSLWEIVLDNFKYNTTVQEEVTESYESFLDFVKRHTYYTALQLSYHGVGEEHNYDTPGRQLNEDYEELRSLV
jgi:hypothetical protein